jgi:hypothetical protein
MKRFLIILLLISFNCLSNDKVIVTNPIVSNQLTYSHKKQLKNLNKDLNFSLKDQGIYTHFIESSYFEESKNLANNIILIDEKLRGCGEVLNLVFIENNEIELGMKATNILVVNSNSNLTYCQQIINYISTQSHALKNSDSNLLTCSFIRPFIEFSSLEVGRDFITDESFEPFFSVLQSKEISVFTNQKFKTNNIQEEREASKTKFESAVCEFSLHEMQVLTEGINYVKDWLNDNQLNHFKLHPWKLVKVKSWLCGGFAHTRGTVIVLSEKYLDFLLDDKRYNSNEEKLIKIGSLLLHEQMHSYQRCFPSILKKLYVNEWGFIYANRIGDFNDQKNEIHNPDAPMLNWIVKNNGKYYLTRILFNPLSENPTMGTDFIDVVFEMKKKNDCFEYAQDTLGAYLTMNFEEFDFFTSTFPVTRGLDHPNEIAAYMFSQYFEDSVNKKKPFQNVSKLAKKNSARFCFWLSHYL